MNLKRSFAGHFSYARLRLILRYQVLQEGFGREEALDGRLVAGAYAGLQFVAVVLNYLESASLHTLLEVTLYGLDMQVQVSLELQDPGVAAACTDLTFVHRRGTAVAGCHALVCLCCEFLVLGLHDACQGSTFLLQLAGDVLQEGVHCGETYLLPLAIRSTSSFFLMA